MFAVYGWVDVRDDKNSRTRTMPSQVKGRGGCEHKRVILLYAETALRSTYCMVDITVHNLVSQGKQGRMRRLSAPSTVLV